MEYLPQVKVSKEDLFALSDLAGDMSIMDYMSKVIREHVAAQQIRAVDAPVLCVCGEPATINGAWCEGCFPDTGRS